MNNATLRTPTKATASLATPVFNRSTSDKANADTKTGSDPRDMLRAQLMRGNSHGMPGEAFGLDEASLRQHSDNASLLNVSDPVELNMADLAFADAEPSMTYYVLSSAGKLVYTNDADHDAANHHVGVMQALISIFADSQDRLRSIETANGAKILFLLKSPVFLVAVSRRGAVSAGYVRTQLEYLYLNILSVVTLQQLTHIFSQRLNFDLAQLIESRDKFTLFDSLMDGMKTSITIFTDALQVCKMDSSQRDAITKALRPPSQSALVQSNPELGEKYGTRQPLTTDLLYAIALHNDQIVTILRPKKHFIYPSDMHLLLNTIKSRKGGELWTPVCLPKFNSAGYLYVYAQDTASDPGTTLVFVTVDQDNLDLLKAYSKHVQKLLPTVENTTYTMGDTGIIAPRHFIVKSRKHVQVTSPQFEGQYDTPAEQERLITLYQHMYERLHPREPTAGAAYRPPGSVIYLRTPHECLLAYTTSSSELYISFPPLLPLRQTTVTAKTISKWVKRNESHLFLSGSNTF